MASIGRARSRGSRGTRVGGEGEIVDQWGGEGQAGEFIGDARRCQKRSGSSVS